MDSASIRWNTNPAMSNGAVIAPNDPGNQNLALGLIGPLLHSIIGPGPCANIVLFPTMSTTFHYAPPPAKCDGSRSYKPL